MKSLKKGATHFRVSFDLVCKGKEPHTQAIQDALGQFFEKDVLEGRISNFVVLIDHAREDRDPFAEPQEGDIFEKPTSLHENTERFEVVEVTPRYVAYAVRQPYHPSPIYQAPMVCRTSRKKWSMTKTIGLVWRSK